MQITWYGHSCFILENDAGVRVLTDPCDPSVGYALRDVACDIVTVSHGHHDHNYVEAAAGAPSVIDTAGPHMVLDVPVTGYPSWHDEAQGKKRGANILFLVELDGMRVLHLGDLGHMLSADALAAIGRVDVLLCPVGGTYTIDASEAAQVVAAIDPAICIPMHYKTSACTLGIGAIEPFLDAVGQTRSVHRVLSSTCTVTKDALMKKRVLLLDYVK